MKNFIVSRFVYLNFNESQRITLISLISREKGNLDARQIFAGK